MKAEPKRADYGPDQLQELLTLTNSLRELHAKAIQILQSFSYFWISRQQRNRQNKLTIQVARQISCVVSRLEQLRDDSQEQTPELIRITVGVICNDCRHAQKPNACAQPESDDEETQVDLIHHNLWPSVDQLSRKVRELRQRDLDRSILTQSDSTASDAALSRLENAMCREHRYLREVIPQRVTKFEIHRERDCVSCGKTWAQMEGKLEKERQLIHQGRY